MDNKLITVTSPLLPNLDDFTAELKKIWERSGLPIMEASTRSWKRHWQNISKCHT